MSRRTRAFLSLMLATVLLASWAPIASAKNYSIEVKGQIGQSGANPTPAPCPTPAPTSKPPGGGGSTSPKTGDDTSIVLYAMTSLLSLFLLVLLWRKDEDRYEGKTT